MGIIRMEEERSNCPRNRKTKEGEVAKVKEDANHDGNNEARSTEERRQCHVSRKAALDRHPAKELLTMSNPQNIVGKRWAM